MLKSHFNIVYDDDEPNEEEDLREERVQRVYKKKKDIGPVRSLTNPEIGVSCSMLGKTVEGDGYTYLKCTITGLKLTNINAIKSFYRLLFVNVSNNFLDLEALQILAELPYLIGIQADNNRIYSAGLKRMKYLQCLIMNDNEIISVRDVYQVELSTLELGSNLIEKIAFDNEMRHLKVLDFKNNRIADVLNLDFPVLDSLYLAGNRLKSLDGLQKLVNLRILHVRNNPIRLLDGFDEGQTKLQYINLRNCKVSTLKQIKKLRALKGLEKLVLQGCPYMGGTGEEDAEVKDAEDDPQLRVEVLAALPRLKRLNKTIVTDEEREESKTLMKQWIEEGEVDEEELVPEEENKEEEEIT